MTHMSVAFAVETIRVARFYVGHGRHALVVRITDRKENRLNDGCLGYGGLVVLMIEVLVVAQGGGGVGFGRGLAFQVEIIRCIPAYRCRFRRWLLF
jgi:hypothetical protein